MKVQKSHFSVFLVLSVFLFTLSAVFAQGNSGAIWTTKGDCGDETQDANHYAIGEVVYINGSNFDANTHLTKLPI